MNETTFGGLLRDMRVKQGVSLRKLASELDISPSYMSDIEKGRRYPPENDKIKKIAVLLQLSQGEANCLFDLAAKSKKNAPFDLADYIMGSEKCRQALRLARDVNAGDETWDKIIHFLICENK